MSESQQLVEKLGISGALLHLNSKLPIYSIPKILLEKNEEYATLHKLIDEVKSLCSHKSTRSECIDYHRRDFGTICNDCGKILNTNG